MYFCVIQVCTVPTATHTLGTAPIAVATDTAPTMVLSPTIVVPTAGMY